MTGFVEIGSVDWKHDQWINSYYPEDLPSDWLFSYFSKQFRTVWLTAAELANKSAEILQGYVDDCDQGFEFLLEIPEPDEVQESPESLQQWVNAAHVLKDHVFAYVACVTAETTVEYINAVRSCLNGSELVALFLLTGTGNAQNNDALFALENVYAVAKADTLENTGDAQILLLDYDSADDMRALGKTLNAFVNQNSLHNKLYCYFKGRPPSYSLMQSAQTIISLLDT